MSVLISQKIQNICLTFVQRRPNVFDVGPTLYKCHTNVLCLRGSDNVDSEGGGEVENVSISLTLSVRGSTFFDVII